MSRGEKDRKANGNGETTPRWFASEQQLELLRDIKDTCMIIRDETRQQTIEARQQTQLLEQITNENMINPRRLQE
jgi:hypothetical protein